MERDELHFNQFYVLTKKEVQRFLNSRIFDKLEKLAPEEKVKALRDILMSRQ